MPDAVLSPCPMCGETGNITIETHIDDTGCGSCITCGACSHRIDREQAEHADIADAENVIIGIWNQYGSDN